MSNLDQKIKNFKVFYMIFSYIVAVLAVVLFLQDDCTGLERFIYAVFWLLACRVGDKMRKDLLEEGNDENIR